MLDPTASPESSAAPSAVSDSLFDPARWERMRRDCASTGYITRCSDCRRTQRVPLPVLRGWRCPSCFHARPAVGRYQDSRMR